MWRKNLDVSETIFALASGPLPSAVAIEKISGPDAFSIASRLFLPKGKPWCRERNLWQGTVLDEDGKPIDDALVLSFVSPNSHSGEDTVEFHCHGAPVIVVALERALLSLGARPAERGEFSYRALLHGRIQAQSVEDLGDVFLARDRAELDLIYRRKDGALNDQIQSLRASMIQVAAIFETAIDFSEEYSHAMDHAEAPLEKAIHECEVITHRYSSFRQGRSVSRLVLAGRPNAGKSSLFNALLCRYRAVVHEEAGTTRDAIEEDIEIDGRSWKLVDTAGFRRTELAAEKMGIELGEDFLGASRAWILVVDGAQGLSHAEWDLLERFQSKPHWVVWNKSDLSGWQAPPHGLTSVTQVSAKTGDGLSQLWEQLRLWLQDVGPDSTGPLPTASQGEKLKRIKESLGSLRVQLRAGSPAEYLAESLRQILGQLESLIGDVGVEDVLERVFHEFCIGK